MAKGGYNPLAPLTPAQLRHQANLQTAAALAPERQAIIAAQKAAQRSQAAQAQRIAGFAKAGAQLLSQQLPQAASAYQGLIGTQTGIASGFSQDLRDRLANIPGAPAAGTADALYALGGYVPASRLATDAAAQYREAVTQPATQLGLGQLGLRSAAATAQEQNKQYVDQLVTLAAKRPGVYQTALQNLQDIELKKLAQVAYNQAAGFKQTQAGIDNRNEFARIYGYDPVTGKPTLAQQKLDQQVNKATATGANIDVAQSKLRGHLVRKDGSDYLDAKGHIVKVPKQAQTGGGGGTWAERHPFQAAVQDAKEIRGKPVTVPSSVQSAQSSAGYQVGKYIAAPWAKGVFSSPTDEGGYVRTTNDPKKAATDSLYDLAGATNYLMEHYGLSPAKARQALAAGGWFTKRK